MSLRNGISGDIYQQIWTADLKLGSGVEAVLPNEVTDPDEGFVVVTEKKSSVVGDLLPGEPMIPVGKETSYKLASALFDNYTKLASVKDVIDPDELAEVDDLLDYIVNTPPMMVAREYVTERTGKVYTDSSWLSHLREMWFRPFAVGSSPSRSGFEHVFLGESKKGKVGGFHWWYYYDAEEKEIDYKGAKYSGVADGTLYPEVVTMSFTWEVDGREITKPTGGFFVGPSVEGLMALGTVRADSSVNAPTTAIIEGGEIDLKLFKSPDGRSVNTFYPVLKRVTNRPPTDRPNDVKPTPPPTPTSPPTVPSAGAMRIVSAFTNPAGADQGRENVTLLNGGLATESVKGWVLVGPRQGEVEFGDIKLAPGEAVTIVLSKRSGVALSNKGGTIKLRSPDGEVVQQAEYPSNVMQGQPVVWDGGNKLIPMV